ncbi:hypothetical protein RXV86_09755 [Alisedimentitalea sp. MJ-SS2]|uniref:hypothetical protein n=1 Tax=Aliisedimentitalea sp. MJ-SS2 TaxID=3049795 RepID=UPI0029107220|nr:hypothetical protein [Alisedimentitalea sp. MJ-SS2]MDU8927668.1 hypothetical protein [Alisedimentitalea sp. MJ-SS2]
MFETNSFTPDSDAERESRLRTVKQMLVMKKYAWASHSFLRHAIYKADDRTASNGDILPGNGLATAIVRLGRKVLIDTDEFDRWVEDHRMQPRVR